MLQFEELRLELEGLQPDLQDLRDALGMEAMEREIAELEQKQAEPGFGTGWKNPENFTARQLFEKQSRRLPEAYGDL